MKKTKVVVALAALAIVAGAYFLLPASAHPYWVGNETAEYVPPRWGEEGYNGSYGPWQEPPRTAPCGTLTRRAVNQSGTRLHGMIPTGCPRMASPAMVPDAG